MPLECEYYKETFSTGCRIIVDFFVHRESCLKIPSEKISNWIDIIFIFIFEYRSNFFLMHRDSDEIFDVEEPSACYVTSNCYQTIARSIDCGFAALSA